MREAEAPGSPRSGRGPLAALPPLSVVGRLERLRSQLAGQDMEAAVITSLANIRWLTGFTGSNGVLVVGLAADDRPATLVTDGRYARQAPAELAEAGCSDRVEVVIARSAEAAAAERFGSVARLGLEETSSWALQRRWDDAFEAELLPISGAVEDLRTVKDAAELARIQAAADIADQALADIRPRLRPGEAERSLRDALDDSMRRAGAAGPAFDTIVASGPNSALPHARPGDRRLQAGDLVVIDLGAEVDGYRSDMTRTFLLGRQLPPDGPPPADPDPPSDPDPSAMLELVTRSQAAGVAAVRPGVAASEIDAACRSVIDEAGLGDAFVHSTGHGVGLDIHELPRIDARSTAVLQPGNVITIEPGVYVPGVGGVRVEDLVVVTDDGCRPLTRHPKPRSEGPHGGGDSP